MPVENILYLGLVISAFATFAAFLAYAEWTTRHAADNTPRRAQIKWNVPHHNEEPASTRKAA
jgi:hypothetical protein